MKRMPIILAPVALSLVFLVGAQGEGALLGAQKAITSAQPQQVSPRAALPNHPAPDAGGGGSPSAKWTIPVLILLLAAGLDLLFYWLGGRRLRSKPVEPAAGQPAPTPPESLGSTDAKPFGTLEEGLAKQARDIDAQLAAMKTNHAASLGELRAKAGRLQEELSALARRLQRLEEAEAAAAAQRQTLAAELPRQFVGRKDFADFEQRWAEMERTVMDDLNDRVKTPRWGELMRYVRDESQQNAAQCLALLEELRKVIADDGPARDLVGVVEEARTIHRRMVDLNRMKQRQKEIRQPPPARSATDRVKEARDVQNLLLLAQNEQILAEVLDFPKQWVRNRFLKAADAFLRAFANGASRLPADERAFENVTAVLALGGLEPVIPFPGTPFDPRAHVGRAAESDPRYNDQVVLSLITCGIRSLESREMIRQPEVVVNRLGALGQADPSA